MYLPIDFIWFETDQLEKNKKWHKITLRGEGGVEGGAAGEGGYMGKQLCNFTFQIILHASIRM